MQSGKRVELKFEQLLEVMIETKVVHSHFIKKIRNSNFYELRIKAGNEYRILLFTIDHANFSACDELIVLNGFIKKSTNDYKKALQIADKLLEAYLKERNHGKDN